MGDCSPGEQMKIAIVCAIGWLDSHGYQYVAPTCIGSMAEFADVVYLVQSTRHAGGVAELMQTYPNIIHIANSYTWFSDREDESSLIPGFHNRNLGIGMQTAAADGAECIVGMHDNWYIPRRNMAALRARCETAIRDDAQREWLYRGTQLGNVLFHASHRVKFVVNPKYAGMMIPGAVADKAHKFYTIQAKAEDMTMTVEEMFAETDSAMVVDVPLEFPMSDMESLFNWSQCYGGRMGIGGSTVFDWDNFKPVYHSLMGKKSPSAEPLDSIGEEIARISQPDFMSHIVLRDLGLEK